MRTPWADPPEIKAKQNPVRFISFLKFLFYLSLCWLQWVFTGLRAFLKLQDTSFWLRWLLLLRSTGSGVHGPHSCGSQALEHRFSSFHAQALLFHGTWDPSQSGMELVSPALAGRCLTTELAGKSNPMYFNGILGPPPINPGLTIAGWIYMWATNASSKTSKRGMHSQFHGHWWLNAWVPCCPMRCFVLCPPMPQLSRASPF